MVFLVAILVAVVYMPYLLICSVGILLGTLAYRIHDSIEGINVWFGLMVLMLLCSVGVIIDLALR